MAEGSSAGSPDGLVEAYTYSAGSYDRLKSNEEELFELVKLSEVPIDKPLFKVILELLRLNVAPAAILQVLKSLRSQSTTDDLGSDSSPVFPRAADSRTQQAAAPYESLPPDRPSARTMKAVNGGVLSDHSDQGSGREGKLKTKKSSTSTSDKPHKSKHKTKASGGSSSSGRHHHHHRDPTGGSAKLKVNEKHPPPPPHSSS